MANKELHLNLPQMKVQLVQANETYVVMGRGTGKSTGIGPEWCLHRIKRMQGSSGFALGRTYQQLLTRTLPPMISYWQKMGLVRDVHFVVGKKPPSSWTAQPLVAPEKWDNTMTFVNGSMMYLISQDRPGIPNSLSLAWGIIDETKLIDMVRFNNDLVPAMRGARELFGHLPEYNSLLFMTDQPTTPEGQWIWEKEKAMNKKQIELILTIQATIIKHQNELQTASSRYQIEKTETAIRKLNERLDQARKNSVLYIEASALDNIDVLGPEYIRKQKSLLPDPVFRVAILNERMTKIDQGFYPALDDKKHCYTKYNNRYLESIELGQAIPNDVRQDGDIDYSKPLYIACDHGASINCLSVGQGDERNVSIKNFFFVLHPLTTEDLITDFCMYYEPMRMKLGSKATVVLIFDHTAIAESGRARNITYQQEITSKLKEYGWRVQERYIGRTPSHTDRYLLWSNCLRGNPDYANVSFNLDHTEVLRMSMHTAPAIPGRKENEIRKDKSSERDKNLSQEKATHPSDSADLLLWGLSNVQSTFTSNSPVPFMIG